MSECPSLEIQDRLPEFVAERLDARAMVEVGDHLRICAACRSDVAVIRSVRAVGTLIVKPDADRIVTAVIAAGVSRAEAADQPAVRLLAARDRRPSPPPASSVRSAWRRVGTWQMAAALAVCVTGAYLTVTTGRPNGTRVVVDSLTLVAGRTTQGAVTAAERSTAVSTSISYGDLTDYSEGELEAMLATLEGWDGASRAEPPSFDPVVSPDGGRVP